MNEFEAFQEYVSLKAHFSREAFDYFKYNGKTNVSVKTYEGRSDRWFFRKLAKLPQPKEFLVSAFLNDPEAWIGNIVRDDSLTRIHRERMARVESLTYHMKSELESTDLHLKTLLSVEGDRPVIIKLHSQGKVSLETATVLSHVSGVIPKWDSKISDDIVWPRTRFKMVKYAPFISYDKQKIVTMIKQLYS